MPASQGICDLCGPGTVPAVGWGRGAGVLRWSLFCGVGLRKGKPTVCRVLISLVNGIENVRLPRARQ